MCVYIYTYTHIRIANSLDIMLCSEKNVAITWRDSDTLLHDIAHYISKIYHYFYYCMEIS